MDYTNASAAVATASSVQQALNLIATTVQLYAYLNPPSGCVQNGSTWDFIVVGGGTSGCVVGSRLAENKSVSVLIIEAGGNFDIESATPGLYPYSLAAERLKWNFTAEPEGYYKKCHQYPLYRPPQGKVLGGTGSIDLLLASQGSCQDYDYWAKLTNESAWSCQNVIRQYKKVENFNDPRIRNSPDARYHGFNGKIGLTKDNSPVNEKYYEAFRRAGYKVVNDININTTEGISSGVFYIANGLAQNSCQNYTTPLSRRPNLTVLKNTTVIRILFDADKRAIGVLASCQDNKIRAFYVTGEVIVCAGTFNTPKLLQLSGIGPKKLLDCFKIPKISILPVGQNYFNHIATVVVANTVKTNCTYVPENNNLRNFPYPTIIVRTPSHRVVWFTIPVTPATSLLLSGAYVFGFNDDIVNYWYDNTQGTGTIFTLVEGNYPESRGDVSITSTNPMDPPKITTGYYSKKVDQDNMIKYVKDWVRTLNEIGASYVDPTSCSSFKKGSDDYWRCYIQCLVVYLTHHGGTAALGSVVDGRGRVLGVTALRVADSSIMPRPPVGSTTTQVTMIGENVAEMIKQDNSDKFRTRGA